jgi:hypothetical protein
MLEKFSSFARKVGNMFRADVLSSQCPREYRRLFSIATNSDSAGKFA